MRTPRRWDFVFIDMAVALARRSKDESTQAGAVLVNPNRSIIGSGFNGPPPQINDSIVPWEERKPELPNKYQYVIHAEENCILDALSKTNRDGLKLSTMFVTHHPCIGCLLRCIHAGVRMIYYVHPYKHYSYNSYHISRLLDSQKLQGQGYTTMIERITDYDSAL
jgi:dCMP deaminase